MAAYLLQEIHPASARAAAFKEDARAVLLVTAESMLRPMVMGNDPVERDSVLTSQPAGETCSAFHGSRLTGRIPELADLYRDARAISCTIVVRVLALDVERQVLDRTLIIDGKMPRDVAGAVPLRPAAEGAVQHSSSMLESGRSPIAGAVNGDVRRLKRELDSPSDAAWW